MGCWWLLVLLRARAGSQRRLHFEMQSLHRTTAVWACPLSALRPAPCPRPQAEAAAGVARPAEPAPAPAAARAGPTPEQVTAIKAAIAAASTLEEVRRLEDALKTGHLPSEITVGGADGGSGAAAMDEG